MENSTSDSICAKRDSLQQTHLGKWKSHDLHNQSTIDFIVNGIEFELVIDEIDEFWMKKKHERLVINPDSIFLVQSIEIIDWRSLVIWLSSLKLLLKIGLFCIVKCWMKVK